MAPLVDPKVFRMLRDVARASVPPKFFFFKIERNADQKNKKKEFFTFLLCSFFLFLHLFPI